MPLVTFQRDDQPGEIVIASPPLTLFTGTLPAALRPAVNEAAASDIRALLVRPEGDVFPAGAASSASWGLINRVVPADSLTGEARAFAQSLASGPTRAHVATKRMLHAWRSGGVAAADRVTHAEGPAVMLSQDLQDGIASLQRSGPGHAA